MLRKLGSFTQHRNFLIRLVIYTLLVSFVPLMAVGAFLYHSVQESMRKDAEMANERYLNQTINAMELVVKHIGSGFRQFVTSDTFNEFDRFPLGNYFRTIEQWRNTADKAKIFDYIKSKSNVQKSMEDLMKMNEYIYSVYYINPSRGIVLTSGYAQHEYGQFYDREWLQDIRPDTRAFPYIMNVRAARQEDGGYKQVIPVVFRPIGTPYTVVINLDAQAFYINLISRFGEKDTTSLIVYSREGKPLLYDRTSAGQAELELVQRELEQEPGMLLTDTVARKTLTDRQLVSWRYSEVLGWNIAGITDLQEMYRNVSNIRGLFVIVAMLLVVVTGILTIVSSQRMYRPVRSLLQFVKEGVPQKLAIGGSSGPHPRGEFKVIRDGLLEAYHKSDQLQQRLRESLPAHQEKFIYSLLRKHAYTPDEIEERFDYLGIALEVRGIVPLIVSLDRESLHTDNIEKEKIELMLVGDTISQMVDPNHPHWLLELTGETYLILVNSCGREMPFIFNVAEAIQRGLAEQHALNCTIGIGSFCETAEELPQAFNEAREALQYQGTKHEGEIIYIEDIRLGGRHVLTYPKEKEATLLLCLKNGDEAKALAVFADWERELKGNAGRVAFSQVQQAYLLLLVGMLETVRELKLDMAEIVPNEHLLDVFWRQEDWRGMARWFEGLISAAARYVGQAFQEKKNTHVEHAKQIIEQEDADKLSLAMIAERLGLNPAYLSRIFKEYTGETFTDYLIRSRMQRGIQLLLHTELKVQEISSRLGYAKVTHFIKLFKEMTGITPGEYRKQHSSS